MLQSILESSSIPLLEKVATFGARRQEVLAGNIANIDTPGYKMRDLPVDAFKQALSDAVEAQKINGKAQSASMSPAKSLDELFRPELFRAVEAAPQNLTFHDANNRSIEHQIAEMTKNSMMQSFAVELMAAQMMLMQAVISERA